jgi:hypothetical protein
MENIIYVSLLSLAILILMYKWKIVDFYDYNKPKWMFNRCEFCFFFWCGVVGLFYMNFPVIDFTILLVKSLCCASLGTFLMSNIKR